MVEKKGGRSVSYELSFFLYYFIGIFKIGIGKYHQLIQFPPKRNPAASQLEFNKNCFYLPSKLI